MSTGKILVKLKRVNWKRSALEMDKQLSMKWKSYRSEVRVRYDVLHTLHNVLINSPQLFPLKVQFTDFYLRISRYKRHIFSTSINRFIKSVSELYRSGSSFGILWIHWRTLQNFHSNNKNHSSFWKSHLFPNGSPESFTWNLLKLIDLKNNELLVKICEHPQNWFARIILISLTPLPKNRAIQLLNDDSIEEPTQACA